MKGVSTYYDYKKRVKLKSREVPVVNCEPSRKQYNIFDFMEE